VLERSANKTSELPTTKANNSKMKMPRLESVANP